MKTKSSLFPKKESLSFMLHMFHILEDEGILQISSVLHCFIQLNYNSDNARDINARFCSVKMAFFFG